MTAFAVSWDYRCPFARNAHEHIVEGLRHGADWEVTWVPFSLNQVHVAEGDPDVWDDPNRTSALWAMQAGIVARDRFPERFLDIHEALFAARHDKSLDIRERDVIVSVIDAAGGDGDDGSGAIGAAVLAEVDDGWPLESFRKEHEAVAREHNVWGVPTFVKDGQAVFVRLMHRPHGDGDLAIRTIERVLDLVGGWPELNEFKHTSLER